MDNILASRTSMGGKQMLLLEGRTLFFQRVLTVDDILDEPIDVCDTLPFVMEIECLPGIWNHIVRMTFVPDQVHHWVLRVHVLHREGSTVMDHCVGMLEQRKILSLLHMTHAGDFPPPVIGVCLLLAPDFEQSLP